MSDAGDELPRPPAPTGGGSGGIPFGVVLLLMGVMVWGFVGLLRCKSGGTPAVAIEAPKGETAAPAAGDAELPVEDPPELAAESAPEPAAESAPEPAAESAPEPEEEPEPEIVTEFSRSFTAPTQSTDWVSKIEVPETVKYTIRTGGSLQRVANLFKIFHHEIQALNPGVDLEKELPPGTPVVIYRAKDTGAGESVDYPGAGTISEPGGMPMIEGPGRLQKAVGWKTYATAETVGALDLALRQWSKRAGAQKVLVGNMSQRGGGRLEPHSTHRSGRDVDIGYIQKWSGPESELTWRKMKADNLDAAETWELIRTFVGTGAVEVIFIDRSLQKILYEYARSQGVREEQLTPWMEYPARTGEGAPLIQHVPGHDDHIHMRFACPPTQARCKSKQRA